MGALATRARDAIERAKKAGASMRKRAAEKTRGLVNRGLAFGTGYYVGYRERENDGDARWLPGSDAEGKIASFPAEAVYAAGGTLAQLAIPGLAGKISDYADGPLDALAGVGGYKHAKSQPRSERRGGGVQGEGDY